MKPQNAISIVLPCYNEGACIMRFMQSLEEVLVLEPGWQFHVIVVDDCSLDDTLMQLGDFRFKAPNAALHLLKNMFNVGHQSSIFQGLLYTERLRQEHVIIMDSDGEDNPLAIRELLRHTAYDIVEVKRRKRSEPLIFKCLYWFYKVLFWLITGRSMNYGNYCMLRINVVEKIRFTSFIHLPAYLLRQKARRHFIRYDRSPRIDGKSKMSYKDLFLHAFKSFVEFGNDLLLWFLRLFGVVFVLLAAILCNLVYQKFIAHTAIPGWFSTLSIGLLNIAILLIGFFVLGTLLINLIHHTDSRKGSIYKIISTEGA
jgi:glycosyltransferase involved in cell wall biosynthesis